MLLQIIVLAGFFLGAKLLVRWWWFRPAYARPGFLRHNETLRTLDFFAVVDLLALFFFLINLFGLLSSIGLTLVLIAYDVGLRAWFLHLETKRLCASSPKWNYREARRRIRQRARNVTAL